MFEALKTWFERRRVLRELRAADNTGNDGFGKYFEEQMRLAGEVFDSGNYGQASGIVSGMRRRFPRLATTSRTLLHLHLKMRAYDEAEAMVREGRKRHPNYDLFAQGYILVAHGRGDVAEALRRCEVMRKKFPRLAEAYSIAAACLTSLGRPAEAETMINTAVGKFPNEVELHVQHARNAVVRRDWPEALRRWEVVKSCFPDEFRGSLGVAQCLKEMGRFDEAEKALEEARERFHRVKWLDAEWAEIATARGDFDEAVRRWKTILTQSPTFALACIKGAEALCKIGREADADELLELSVARLTSDLYVHLAFARGAALRGDWTAAARRWALVRQRFPDCEEAAKQETAAQAASERLTASMGE